MTICPRAFILDVNFASFEFCNLHYQGRILLDNDLWNISGIILTYFKLLLYHKLKGGTRCPFILRHPIANSYFRYVSSIQVPDNICTTKYSSREKFDSHSPIYSRVINLSPYNS